jgi:hypothetical protein
MKSKKNGRKPAPGRKAGLQGPRSGANRGDGPESGNLTPTASPKESHGGHHWTFLTNHSHVLVLLSRDSSIVLREVALRVGITERAVQRIIAELESGGVIEREKVGRQNHYRIRHDQPLRHPIEAHRSIGDLLELLNGKTV